MAHNRPSPHVLDQPWRDLGEHRRFRHLSQRRYSRRADHSGGPGPQRRDRRLHRDLPGSWHFARIARTATDYRSHAAVSGVASGVDAGPVCKFSLTPNRNGVAPKRRRFASPVMASKACRRLRSIRILPANQARRFTSNSMTIGPAAGRIS